jgi:glycosyltransferase involved in cell wall biosynthesis
MVPMTDRYGTGVVLPERTIIPYKSLMGKKRLLYISTWIPGSWHGGTEMRAAHHIRILSELFDVTLAIVGNHGSEAEAHGRVGAEVRAACVSVVLISRSSAINRLLQRTPSYRARVLFEALWPTPLLFAPYPPAVAELGRRLAGERFDVVHCFRLDAGILRLLKQHGIIFGRSVLDFDSYESQAEFRSIRTFQALIGKPLSAVSWLRAVKWWMLESLLIPSFDDVVVSSEFDRQRLRRRFPGTRWHVVPNIAAEPSQFNAVKSDQFTFLFVGQLGYLPNWDAVVFFCTDVLPILRRDAPGRFRVLIVGRAGGDLDRLTAIDEVRVVVNPPDLAYYYAQSDAVIVPLRGGGGTRVKILEALSYGLPVISTTIGAEGLEVTPGSDIIIADGREAFAEQCLRIWRDEFLRRQIAGAGRDLWRRKYSPSALVPALNAAYERSESGSTAWPVPNPEAAPR